MSSDSPPAVSHERAAGPAASAAPAAPPTPQGLQPGLVVAWGLAVVAIVIGVLLWQKIDGMQEQLARQSGDAGQQSVEARTLAQQAEDAARDAAAKVGVMEARLGEMTAYRSQLEELAHAAMRARDETLAVELEAALRVAQDQTQLTGSVEPLLAALRVAETRLARSSDPRLTPVAKAVTRDLERVRTTSVPDTAGLLARIDQLLRQVDELPMANSVGTASLKAPRQKPAPGKPVAAQASVSESWWVQWWHSITDEADGLLRVSRVERPEATMVNPEQAFFVRENLKLRLQGARLALLARQYEAARADLAAAQSSLGSWFDPSSRRTQSAATLLQQIQGLTKSADLPRAQESLLALGHAVALTSSATAGGK